MGGSDTGGSACRWIALFGRKLMITTEGGADRFDYAARMYMERMLYLEQVLLQVPETCREGLLARAKPHDCTHCRRIILGGFQVDEAAIESAADRVLYHLSNQDCDGAAQLRRREASRMLDGLGAPA